MTTGRSHRVWAALAVVPLLAGACTGDETETADPDGEQASAISAAPLESAPETTAGQPQPELSVPALVDGNAEGITVGGWVFEFDGVYLLCEGVTDTEPPDCAGDTLEIANGDVIDPVVFLGEPGSRYSDAEVVVTGDVVEGVLTIG